MMVSADGEPRPVSIATRVARLPLGALPVAARMQTPTTGAARFAGPAVLVVVVIASFFLGRASVGDSGALPSGAAYSASSNSFVLPGRKGRAPEAYPSLGPGVVAAGYSAAGEALCLCNSMFVPVASMAPTDGNCPPVPICLDAVTPSPVAGAAGQQRPSHTGTPTPTPTAPMLLETSTVTLTPTPTVTPTASVSPSASVIAPSPSSTPPTIPPAGGSGSGSGRMPRVAIGIRASVVWMERWRALLNAMKLRDEIALFFSLWKEEADEAQVASWRAEPNSPLLSVRFEPGVTVTPGRNLVLQSIYAEEVARGKRFESWVIADADAAFVECYRCPVTQLPEVTGAACCMDYFIGLALNRAYNFSSISSILAREEYPPFEAQKTSEVIDRMFQFRDCADAQLQAYHRDYVPIVFPYHEELEDISWWSSQGMLFRYTSTCGPGNNVLPGRNFRPNLQEHIDYPKMGRDIGREEIVVREAYPELADFPINAAVSPGLMCNTAQRGVITLDPTVPGQGIVDWRATASFKKCLAVRERVFVSVTGKGVPQAPA
jgi:hypothetical protein